MEDGSSEMGTNLSGAIQEMSLGHESTLVDAEFDSEGEEEAGEDGDEELMVTLGFVQPIAEPWRVGRQHFPSKIGGTPAWLDPINIPEGDDSTSCGICGNPLGFLMQVYAALAREDLACREEVFHRSFFVFVCPNMVCLQQDQHHQSKKTQEKSCRSVKVFRSQLPRKNRFYSYEPPPVEAKSSPLCETVPLCTWCGTWKGSSICGGCRQARYCCRVHQLAHWQAGHDVFCREMQSRITSSQASIDDGSAIGVGHSSASAVHTMVQGVLNRVAMVPLEKSSGITPAVSDKLWPEMELIVEDEEDTQGGSSGTIKKAQHLLEDYERRLEDGGEGEEFSASDMQDVEDPSSEHQYWVNFHARLDRAPEQVLRYCRGIGANPLWPSLKGQPTERDIVPCENCGGPRIFEFQLVPQLLYFLGVQNSMDSDSLDWATIVVYSCAASCYKEGLSCEGYVEEFPWVQLAIT